MIIDAIGLDRIESEMTKLRLWPLRALTLTFYFKLKQSGSSIFSPKKWLEGGSTLGFSLQISIWIDNNIDVHKVNP